MAHKPLLLEKPMAVSAMDAEAIREDFFRIGLSLTIGQTLRYNRVVSMLRDQLNILVRCTVLLPIIAWNRQHFPGWMSHRLPGAGVSLQTAVHVFDALRFITGQEIVRVLARTQRRHTRHLEDHLVVWWNWKTVSWARWTVPRLVRPVLDGLNSLAARGSCTATRCTILVP
jgi:predicted dehydrogenase